MTIKILAVSQDGYAPHKQRHHVVQEIYADGYRIGGAELRRNEELWTARDFKGRILGHFINKKSACTAVIRVFQEFKVRRRARDDERKNSI